jgi:hypothetical protein
MTARLRTAFSAVACAAAVLVGGQRAAAESVSLIYNHQTPNSAVTTSLGTTPTGPFYWTENTLPPNTSFPPPTSTFCIEIGGKLPDQGLPAVFGVQSLTDTFGTTTAAEVTSLYSQYYDTAWDSSSFGGSANSIAFQLALWELVYDGKAGHPLDLSGGTFSVSPAIGSIYTTAQNMLNSLAGGPTAFNREIVVLHAPDATGKNDWQDQITTRPPGGSAVPAPPAVVLAGIGLVGLIGRSRWLRRKPAAV